MAFSKREPRQRDPASSPWLVRLAEGIVRNALRFAFGVVIIAVIVAGLLYLRLSQGPINLPYLAQIVAQVFNDDSDRFEASLGDLVVTLGEAGSPSGVQFVDLKIRDAEGTEIFVIPRLSAKFDIADLLRGHLWPTQIALIRPEARLQRGRDGKFKIGLGSLPSSATASDKADPIGDTAQVEAISRILDGLTGDGELTPELSRLREIVIAGADLTYENVAIGRQWRTKRADLRIVRIETGLLGKLTIDLADGVEAGAGVVVTAERRRGSGGATRLDARFERLRPEHLAEQLEQIKWLSLFDAPLNGNLGATLHADGRIEGLSGRISAGAGRILALRKKGQPFERIDLAFAYEAGLERMQVSELTLVSPALDTQLTGFVDLGRSADGTVSGLAGQFEVAGIRAEVRDVFADPLNFDGGRIAVRLEFDPLHIQVAEARLQNGDLVIGVSGDAREDPDGWKVDLRAAGKNLSIGQLVEHWPLLAAKNARKWVNKNIHSGGVDEFVGHMRFGSGKPLVNLDFTFSELVSSYLKDMTPIENASGRGTLTLNTFDLLVERGEVVPVEGSAVQLAGSVIRMPDLEGRPSPALITLRASGETSTILTLINEQPLGLIDKLGLDPATIRGNGEVVAEVTFPLIQALELNGVEVHADANLADLRMPFRLPGGQLLDVAGKSVELSADKLQMSLSGAMRIDGSPMFLGWSEYYGRGKNNREISLRGAATPALLKRFDLDNEYFVDGHAPMKLHLTQAGLPEFAFNIDADMGPAKLDVRDFAWAKPPGPAGRLQAEGVFGDGIRVSEFRLNTDDLKANGAIEFADGGEMQSAQVARLQFRGLADVALAAQRVRGGGLSLNVHGRSLDLALFGDTPDSGGTGASRNASGGVTPMDVEFNLDQLIITPRVVAQPGSGNYRRDASRHATATLDGLLAGKEQFTAEYEKAGSEPGKVLVESKNAGALLKAAGLFRGADGGRLKLRAQIAPEPGVDLVGVTYIRDVRISGASTFKSILDEGDLDDAADAAEGDGLFFDKVEVPFEYRDGLMILGDSTAKGTLLAVTMEGTVDENSDEVDLVGVISPAYALTGIVDEIPVIGSILTGGKGEGILAMTFKVKGPLDGPDFSVNALSLLAPGILRNIFSGRSDAPNEDFIERLKRDEVD
jgi:hypothetical protein